jgi:hypothetical protein
MWLKINILYYNRKICKILGLPFSNYRINRKFKQLKMKKVMSLIAVALFTATFVACGPSAEEKAKMEENAKRIADSITESISKSMAPETPAVDTAAATPTATVEEKH